jgi:hypothetical protein
MFKSKISKEEVNQMPISVFEGQITLVDELWQVKDAVAVLKQSAFLGVDTETKPSFTRGVHHKISFG